MSRMHPETDPNGRHSRTSVGWQIAVRAATASVISTLYPNFHRSNPAIRTAVVLSMREALRPVTSEALRAKVDSLPVPPATPDELATHASGYFRKVIEDNALDWRDAMVAESIMAEAIVILDLNCPVT